MKISLDNSLPDSTSKITQFEYTIAPYNGIPYVWYDGSNVNCVGTDCPFEPYGLNLISSMSSCPTRNCTAGSTTCPGFYTVYNDDENTLSCNDSADTMLYLCSGKGGSGGSGGSSSPVVSYAAVASSSAASPVSSSVYVPVSSSVSVPASSSVAAPVTTSYAVQTMEAPATTFVTVTSTKDYHYHGVRGEGHIHARHHQH